MFPSGKMFPSGDGDGMQVEPFDNATPAAQNKDRERFLEEPSAWIWNLDLTQHRQSVNLPKRIAHGTGPDDPPKLIV
jgi:hypothetical protein